MILAAASALGHLVKRRRTREPSRPTPPSITVGVGLASSVDTKNDRRRGDRRRAYVKIIAFATTVARGAVGTAFATVIAEEPPAETTRISTKS